MRQSVRVLLATALAGAAVCVALGGASIAASAAVGASTSAAASGGSASEVAQQLAWSTGLGSGESKQAAAFSCPAAYPWLENRRYSTQDVPAGVVVGDHVDSGHVVTITALATDDGGRVTGWRADAANVGSSDSDGWVAVSAYCTKNPGLAYLAP